ncbi:helix-turn-helix transcriptional regulator [Bradyrhizobium sp. LeoA1S1]
MPKLLTFPELAAHGIRLGRRQIDRLEAAGRFPRRVQISPGRVGWLADEIEGHVAEAIARRPALIGSNDESLGPVHA